MKLLDIIESDELIWIRQEVSEFTELLLREYIEKTKTRLEINFVLAPKDIHDAVWGTIALNAGEVIIIDSPLIQRLRSIQHLGLASLVFPGAEYSRFEHTLGTLHVANKMAKKIASNDAVRPLPNHFCPCQLTRLAAIFHDAGHMFCSHASERYYAGPFFSRSAEVSEAIDFLMEKTASLQLKLSELLSVLIVVSPAVIELLALACPHLKFAAIASPNQVKEISGLVSSLILGLPVNLTMLPFSTIISGPIDADKCDYLARDSHRTGVPVAVDLSRVIHKLVAIKGMPRSFGDVWDDKLRPSEDECFVSGIALSAVKSDEEILMSRTLMHEKIYFHQKILTAEETLRHSIRILESSGTQMLSNFSGILSLTDHDLINSNSDIIIKTLSKKHKYHVDSDGERYRKATNILKSITYRDLFKRACTISRDLIFPTDPTIDIDSFLRDVFETVSVDKQDRFTERLVSEAHKIMKITKGEDIGEENLEDMVLLVSYPSSLSSDLDMPIDFGGRIKYYREFYQGELWDNSRKMKNQCHFIVSRQDITTIVYIAAEKVLYSKYKIILSNDSFRLCKINESELSKLKNSLLENGYYNCCPAIAPDLDFLDANNYERLQALVSKWQSYEGPHGKKIHSVAQIVAFLKQFIRVDGYSRDLIAGMVCLLEHIDLLTREKIVDSLYNMITEISIDQKVPLNSINFSVLGNIQDSSYHMSYYMNDVKSRFSEELSVRSIRDILLSTNEDESIIVFIDDAYYSGTQLVCIFQEMMGIPLEKRIIRENHDVQLESHQIKKLKKKKCILCFCYSNMLKTDVIKKSLSDLGLNIKMYWHKPFPEPLFSSDGCAPFTSDSQKHKLMKCLKRIGYEILSSKKKTDSGYSEGWDEERLQECSLGYSDAQQCLVLPWNTPTYTLTPLWAEGFLENGTPWRPLFPRLSK